MIRLLTRLLVVLALGCGGGVTHPAVDLGGACQLASDCPISAGAACATVCADGSNPCRAACVDGECALRGCPTLVTVDGGIEACSSAADCGVNPAASCAATCDDGSNPCAYACIDGMCAARGCSTGMVP